MFIISKYSRARGGRPDGSTRIHCRVRFELGVGLNPKVKLYGCEPDTASPLADSFAAGERVVADYTSMFIESAGAPILWPEMWDLGKRLQDGSLVASVEETASAVRLLAERNRVIAEVRPSTVMGNCHR